VSHQLRIGVTLGGVEHMLTMQEWTSLIAKGNAEWQKMRTKCPTCRCKVLPDETCWCCKGRECETEEYEPDPFL
jgi:hypothetical protein